MKKPNLDSSYFSTAIFMERHTITIYTFSLLFSWFCFSLEISDETFLKSMKLAQ